MRLQLISDLHLDHHTTVPPVTKSADILVIAGDIANGFTDEAQRFLTTMASQFEQVIFILGNHDFYGWQPMEDVILEVERWVNARSNLIFLHNDYTEIEGKLVFGGPMWTAYWGIMQARLVAETSMLDFDQIGKGYQRPTPSDFVYEHTKFCEALGNLPAPADLIISHHAPSKLCIDERFAGSRLNPAFCEPMTLEYKTTWVHGHMHQFQDIIVPELSDSRVVRNPYGYGHGEELGYDPAFTIEI